MRIRIFSITYTIIFGLCMALLACVGKEPKPQYLVKTKNSTDAPTWVAKADGSKSCGMGNGMSVKEAAQQLLSRGVKVLEIRKGNDGLMHPMVCGAATGDRIEARIMSHDLAKAKELNFQVISEAKE